jgi:hypothetical protein
MWLALTYAVGVTKPAPPNRRAFLPGSPHHAECSAFTERASPVKKSHPILVLVLILAALFLLYEFHIFALMWWLLKAALFIVFLAAIAATAYWAWKTWSKE